MVSSIITSFERDLLMLKLPKLQACLPKETSL